MIIKIMSKRNSLLGSEGGTWNKDDPVLQDRCLVLNGEVGISRLEDVGESVLGEGMQSGKKSKFVNVQIEEVGLDPGLYFQSRLSGRGDCFGGGRELNLGEDLRRGKQVRICSCCG